MKCVVKKREKFSKMFRLTDDINSKVHPPIKMSFLLRILCGVGIANLEALINHERTDAGNKPYKCDFRTEAFTRSEKLARHEGRTH
jgi:hypothetical protein